jgi:hypothetical protein
MRIAHMAQMVAGLVLVGGMVTACGDDASDAPDDASKDDFCKVLEEAPTDEKPSQDDVDDWADKLRDTGTPEGIDDDARHGFEVLIEALDDVDVDDIDEDDGFDDVVKDSGDRKDVEKLFVYLASECSGLGDDVPTELPTDDVPTELPTDDLPSDLPSDIPSLPSGLPSDFPTDIES